MAIEFHCQQCNTLLKTPDDSAGQQAKCPKCGALTTIPTPSVAAATPAYGPPAAMGGAAMPGGTGLRTTIISVGDILNWTWPIYKANMGLCIGAVVVNLLITGIANQMVTVVAKLVSDGGRNEGLLLAIMALAWIPIMFLTTWLNVGMITLLLRVARGGPAEIGLLFSGGDKVLPAFGVSMLLGLVVGLGYLLCIIPGIIFGLMFSQSLNLVVDQNVDPLDAMKQSKQITTGNKWTLFLLVLVGIGINLLGVMALCVGALFTIPFTVLMAIVAYLAMSGQRINIPAA